MQDSFLLSGPVCSSIKWGCGVGQPGWSLRACSAFMLCCIMEAEASSPRPPKTSPVAWGVERKPRSSPQIPTHRQRTCRPCIAQRLQYGEPLPTTVRVLNNCTLTGPCALPSLQAHGKTGAKQPQAKSSLRSWCGKLALPCPGGHPSFSTEPNSKTVVPGAT